MSQIYTYAGSILQSTQVQRQQTVEKSRQIRRTQELEKNVALQDDQMEHSVESSEELTPIRDDQHQQNQPRQQSPHQQSKQDPDDAPHVDVTA